MQLSGGVAHGALISSLLAAQAVTTHEQRQAKMVRLLFSGGVFHGALLVCLTAQAMATHKQ